MAALTYKRKVGTYSFGGYRWQPGQTLEVKADVAAQIKDDPEASELFLFNGRVPAKVVPPDERPVSTAEQDQIGNDFPANGFKTKASAVEWAAKHLPDVTVDTNRALAIITETLLTAYTAKTFPKETREEHVITTGQLPAGDPTTTEGAIEL